jgi:protein-disulfide isomerase
MILLGTGTVSWARGTIELSAQRTLAVNEEILDVAVSQSGKWLYVLTPKGEVLAFSGSGQLDGRVAVGKEVDGIRMGPTEQTLVLTSRKEKQVKVIVLDFLKEINTAGSPFKGPEGAPVVITVFSEFQCPHCASLAPVLDQLLEKHRGQVKVVFKNYLIRNHPFAMNAAVAALAAHKQGRFWPYHDRLFQNVNQLSNEKIQEIAAQLGLDMDRFRRDLQSQELMARLRQDLSDAAENGVSATPTVFVNGRYLRDTSLMGFETLVAMAMEKPRSVSDPCGKSPGEEGTLSPCQDR